jgi:hypothetical protein
MRTELTFVGQGSWNGGDIYPSEDTPFPRIPAIGEHVSLPDSALWWHVTSVRFDFADGLYYEPLVRIRLELG